jgi:hypothetical protein
MLQSVPTGSIMMNTTGETFNPADQQVDLQWIASTTRRHRALNKLHLPQSDTAQDAIGAVKKTRQLAYL